MRASRSRRRSRTGSCRRLPDDEDFDQQWALENTGQRYEGDRRAGTPAGRHERAAGVGRHARRRPGRGRRGHGDRRLPPRPCEPHRARRPLFVVGDSTIDDGNGHGTEVAGLIAAQADNGIDVAGIAPDASVLPLKAFAANGQGSSTAVAAAFNYAGDLGVRSSTRRSAARTTATPYARRSPTIRTRCSSCRPAMATTTATGSATTSTARRPGAPMQGRSTRARTRSRTSCASARTPDYKDIVTFDSNYGAKSVDLFAPGASCSRSTPDGDGARSGTSMAAALVSGVAALLAASHPSLNAV